MENRKSLILHFDSLDVIDELTKEQIAELFIAIRDYNLGKEIKLDGLMKAVFIPFKNQFDRDLEKYNSICERNRNNGKKGGRPKQTEENPVGYLETEENQNEPKKAYSKNDSNSDNKNDNKKESNNNIILSKDKEQSSEIVKVDKRVIEIDIIIETLKEINMGVLDDTIKKQRQYGKLIKDKIGKIKGFSGDYVSFIQYCYQNSDEYRKNHFRSAEKFYYNIANIVAGLKIQAEKKPIRRGC